MKKVFMMTAAAMVMAVPAMAGDWSEEKIEEKQTENDTVLFLPTFLSFSANFITENHRLFSVEVPNWPSNRA